MEVISYLSSPIVILSEHSEPKDLRTDLRLKVIKMRRSLDSIFIPLGMTESYLVGSFQQCRLIGFREGQDPPLRKPYSKPVYNLVEFCFQIRHWPFKIGR